MSKAHLLLLFALFLSCSTANNNIAGTGSETDTGCAVAGLVLYANNATVPGANVILHDQMLLKRITLSKSLARNLTRSDSTKTNINGFFRIDSVDTGHFLVEINDHDTLGAVLPTQILPTDTLVQVNGILRHLGTITGRVDTTQLKGRTGTIYLPEIGRRGTVNAQGYFTITNLPVWNYQIRLAIGDSIVVLSSDTIHVPVTEKSTTTVTNFGAKTGTVIIRGSIIENSNHP